MNLSQVSRTAILTLMARALTSERGDAGFDDPMAQRCLQGLISLASPEEKKWMLAKQRLYAGISAHDARAGAERAKIFDEIAKRYIAANPQCSVVNLACGFDTRYWRIAPAGCRYLEVDLPEVIALKRAILKEQLAYELIGCSVLDPAWIDQVTAQGNSRFLLLAEGLLMFLPQPEVVRFFQLLSQGFSNSHFALDMVPQKYLHGVWKFLIRLETRINWGLDVAWQSGVRDPRELETYAPGLKVLRAVRGSAGPVISGAIHAQ